jgi:hypothetical protein
MNVQVVRFNSGPPPNWSTLTTDFTTLFYQNNVAGTAWIPVSISVQAGDIMGIIGARGTSTMYNAYAAANTYNTTILGQPVTIERLIAQINLYSQQAVELCAEPSNPYGMVEMQYSP